MINYDLTTTDGVLKWASQYQKDGSDEHTAEHLAAGIRLAERMCKVLRESGGSILRIRENERLRKAFDCEILSINNITNVHVLERLRNAMIEPGDE